MDPFDSFGIVICCFFGTVGCCGLVRICCDCRSNRLTKEEEDLEAKDPKTITKISDVWVVQDCKPEVAV